MNPNIIEIAFTDPKGCDVEVWITYYGIHVGAVSYASAPFWQIKDVQFPIERGWL
jgi:hypothetical protein